MLHFSLPATLPTQQRRGLFGTVTVHRASRVGALVGCDQEFCRTGTYLDENHACAAEFSRAARCASTGHVQPS